MRSIKMKTITIALAALALLPSAAPAATASAAPAVHVSYADLNLHSDAGIRALDRRLAQAARAVCADGSTDLSRQLAARRCIADTLAAATAERQRVVAGDAVQVALASRPR
jgi:UrcA family protein